MGLMIIEQQQDEEEIGNNYNNVITITNTKKGRRRGRPSLISGDVDKELKFRLEFQKLGFKWVAIAKQMN